MMRPAALALINKMEATWPDTRWSQVRIDQWAEILENIDEGHAGTAFVRLRSSSEKCPSMAEFVKSARSVAATQPAENVDECDWCDGTGWADGGGFTTDDGRRYTSVTPCTCTAGRAAQQLKQKNWPDR